MKEAPRRYQAEWMARMAYHPTTGDVEPELCEYHTEAFGTLEAAARACCERSCCGSEGFVNVQELTLDTNLFEATGLRRRGWRTVERYLCQGGVVVERVDG
jgi:hypothetical protein